MYRSTKLSLCYHLLKKHPSTPQFQAATERGCISCEFLIGGAVNFWRSVIGQENIKSDSGVVQLNRDELEQILQS